MPIHILTTRTGQEERAVVDLTQLEKANTKVIHATIKYGFFKNFPEEVAAGGDVFKVKRTEGYIPLMFYYVNGEPTKVGIGWNGKSPLKEFTLSEMEQLKGRNWDKVMQSALFVTSMPSNLYLHLNNVCKGGVCFSKK